VVGKASFQRSDLTLIIQECGRSASAVGDATTGASANVVKH